MRIAGVGLVLFASGLLAGYLLFRGDATPPRADTRRPAAAEPERPAPPDPPTIAPAEPPKAGPSEREQWEATRANLFEEIRKRDQRIHDLERELEVARKMLPAPAILTDLGRATPQELLDLVQAIGRVGEEKLLAVPEEVRARYASLLGLEDAGAARIVERGRYDAIVQQRGGGAYYSFATRTNDYNKEPDLELQQGSYSTSFYGGTFGFVFDLGDYPIENVPRGTDAIPAGLTPQQEDAWRFLASEVPADREGRRAWEKRGKDLGLKEDQVKAHPEHTYLLRAVLPGEHDILVAFRDAHRNDTGHTIVWREIARWPAPR
jgi:hypothetical protein